LTSRTIAGWIALASGTLLIAGMLFTTSSTSPATGFPMGPGMIGGYPMGPGMMGVGGSGPAASAIPGAPEIRVDAFNFGFSPSEVHLPKNTDVNLTLSNPAGNGVLHDFTVPSLGIHVVANAGETRTIGLHGLSPGRYDAYCSVPGHAQAGMRATVIVE
jgi:heme/copper-type cytochrome/quinol oxidase subunit 2